MAFVAVVPAVGTGIATIGGLGSTALAGLGGLASSIPVLGSVAAPALTGLGGAVGSLGAGLGGSLMGGGLGALTGGLGGAASSLLGSGAAAGGLGSGLLGMGSGLGGLYAGADKLLGGFLPNLGIGGTITPAQGFLGQAIPGMQNMPMFGGTDPTAATGYGTVLAPPEGGFPSEGGGLMGAIKGIADKVGKGQALLGAIDATRNPGGTPQSVEHSINLQRPPQPTPNGGRMPGGERRQNIFQGNQGPQLMLPSYPPQYKSLPQSQFPSVPLRDIFTPRVGADSSLSRAFGNGPGQGTLR